MLVIRGNKKIIQQIFIDHNEAFQKKYGVRIRPDITWNVDRMISCGTVAAGYHLYQCPNCLDEKIVPHTCKSRFCSTCGVKATDVWIERYTTLFPECQYQHLTFSPPHELLDYFQNGREDYFNALYHAAYLAIMDYCLSRGYRPGAMSVIHTFGRSLSWHVHLHILISYGGLDKTETKWKNNFYIPHEVLKDGFKKHFLAIIQKLWKKEDPQKYIPSQRYLFTKTHQLMVLQKV